MSGIAALFARGGAPADPALLADLVAAQRFRGPDGQGSWHRGSVGLGHTLHATTIEAARERSPASLDDRLFIAADARIDARDELGARLRQGGRDVPRDVTDAELILLAYDAWGVGCFQHLLGDFSFAIWDAPRRQLVCAVDALGARAFYYADRAGLFVGGNSLACARLHGGVRDQLNEHAVGDFIRSGCYQDRDVTIYADIARIPPGHFLVVTDEGARLQRHFTWPEPAETRWARPEDCVEAFSELLGRAVADRLRTPKVAVLMSGGVDSPLIALTAKRELERRFSAPELRAYCSAYDRLIPDEERRFAGVAARGIGISLDVQPMDDGVPLDWVGRISPPEPTADFAIGPFLDQVSRLAGHSPVALTGYDGDTLLLASLRAHWRQRVAQGRLGTLARELSWYARRLRGLPPLGVRTHFANRRRAREVPRRPAWLREAFWSRASLAQRWSPAPLPTAATSSHEPAVHALRQPAWGSLFDLHDAAYLGRAIEFRHPLVDLRVIRFALALPAIPWCVDKHLLRQCLAALPEEIRGRPKTPLAADPIIALLRRRGFGCVRAPEPSAILEAFVDPAALSAALEGSKDAAADPWQLLRAVAFGTWLEHRAARGSHVKLPEG